MISLFRKKDCLKPADECFFRFAKKLRSQFQPSDVFLTSFPRSGNTWMRYLIAGCLGKPVEILIPDLHQPGIKSVSRHSRVGNVYLFKSHTICDLKNFKKIYIFRNPADSLVSYAHFAGRAEVGCDNFVKKSLKTWAHQASAVQTSWNEFPDAWHLVSYERMLGETKLTLLSVFKYLGADSSNLAIDQAIKDSAKVPRINKGVGNYVSAASGQGKMALEASTLQQIEEIASPIYSKLCDSEDEQNLRKEPARP